MDRENPKQRKEESEGGGEKKERSKRRGQDEELRGRSIDADFVEINEYLALIQCKQRRRRVRMKRYIYIHGAPLHRDGSETQYGKDTSRRRDRNEQFEILLIDVDRVIPADD